MSDYQIIVTRSAQKELNSLSPEISIRIESKINSLVNNPRPSGCRKLKGRLNRWRIRVGDCRVIYSINDKNFTIQILEVGHRRDIYK